MNRVKYLALSALLLCTVLVLETAPAARAQNVRADTYFLIATPGMADPLFQHSVILMLPETEPPLVAGLIVNKPTKVQVRDLFPHAPALKNHADTTYFGGPVDMTAPSLVFRSSQPTGKAMRVLDDVYVSDDPDAIETLLKNAASGSGLRLVLGRAQWSEDQLQGEMLQRSWFKLPASSDMVFSPNPERLWRILVGRAQLEEAEAIAPHDRGGFALLAWSGAIFLRGPIH